MLGHFLSRAILQSAKVNAAVVARLRPAGLRQVNISEIALCDNMFINAAVVEW